MRIVLTEYPKSGGTWVASMLGDAQGLPKRDLYTDESWRRFGIFSHPWYAHADSTAFPMSCVIKSHEFPGSQRTQFDARYVHLLRDGRDAVVSFWHHESDLELNNGYRASFNENFDDFVRTRAELWARYVRAWRAASVPEFRYENFLRDPAGQLQALHASLGLDCDETRLHFAVLASSKQRMHRSFQKLLPNRNVFVRRAVAGDWRKHFSPRNILDFKAVAGRALIEFGYERNDDW